MTDHSPLIVGVGASAGGVNAFKAFFSNVSADSGMTYVAILHLSPDHESKLAEILQAICPIPVTEVSEKIPVEPNHVYVVSPSQSLAMSDGFLVPSPTLRLEERRAPIDIFFRTLAESHQARSACVVLSGTGADGSMGLKSIKEHGGICLVQDPSEAEFADMPRSALATGLADAALPAAEIPRRLEAYRASLAEIALPEEPQPRTAPDERALHELFATMRSQTGHDFSNYKRATLMRRVARRISVSQAQDLQQYVQMVREQPAEAKALLKDLLISVTRFFRDPEAFKALEQQVIPALFAGKGEEGQVRVWVAGCATGEEAYSIAMLLAEYSAGPESPSVQVFATDIDEQALAVARDGLYTINDAADVSPERLRRFFTKDRDRFQVRKELREMVLFARHNVIKDPPFSHLDLVSCRNLLIYLNRPAQERVLEVMHFALRPRGFLFLGTAESVEGTADLFVPVDKDAHLFQSRGGAGRAVLPMPPLVSGEWVPRGGRAASPQAAAARERLVAPELHQRLLEQYAAPSVLVNDEHQIVHLSERAGRFLQVAGGEPTHNLMKAVRPELRLELRTALLQAAQQGSNVETRGLPLRIDDRSTTVKVLVRPVVRHDDPARGFFLVLFEETRDDLAQPAETTVPTGEPAQQMEEEIGRLRSQLRTTIEQHETQAEELKASNEELQAINEELRSASEELETSKEELQSVNEELRTVNQELKVKIEEQTQASNDIQNLINSTDIGTVFLDRASRIKLFTPRARDIFSLIPGDRGRSLDDINSHLVGVDLHAAIEHVLERLDRVEREVTTRAAKWYLMRIVPYRTANDRIEGVVLTFVDITERKGHLEELRQSEERLRRALEVETVGVIFFSLESYVITDTNHAFLSMSGYDGNAARTDRLTWEVLTAGEARSRIPQALEDLRTTGHSLTREVDFAKADGSRWVGLFTATKLDDREGVAYVIDVTGLRRATEALQNADRRKNEFLATLAHELRNPLAPIVTSVHLLKAAGRDASIGQKALETIERQVNHLVRLAEDLVEVSRITLGKIEFRQEVIDLRVVIKEAIDAVATAVKAGKYQVTVDMPSEPLPVMADPARLMQVFVNLLNNALKYTPRGGRISVAAKRDAESAKVTVEDNGIGISPLVLPYVFDLFTQGSKAPSDLSRGGLGVGLALVRTLVQGHGGTVGIRSEGAGKGTEVTVTLPLTGLSHDADAPAEDALDLQGRAVLIVDDNRDAADSLAALLSTSGADVDVGYSGLEALALLANKSYAVAFIDLGMPGMDGFEVAKSARRDKQALPLVALTGWGQDSDRLAALAAGFDEHMTKPASVPRLHRVLKTVLRSQRER